MTTYRIITDRRTAALYLAWEFGTKRAIEIMNATPRGAVEITAIKAMSVVLPKRTKKALQAGAERILAASNFQRGRLGKQAGGFAFVEAA